MNTETRKQLKAIDVSCRNEIDPSILADVFIIASDIPADRAEFVDAIIEQAEHYPTLADRLVCMQANIPTYARRLQAQICDLDHECFVFHYGK